MRLFGFALVVALASSVHCQVSEADKKVIIDLHNKLRNDVSPPPTNMQKAIWDENIAATAQRWASQCASAAHDSGADRVPPTGYRYISVGQNMHSVSDWTTAINGWYSEVNNFQYGIGSTNGKEILHFTQIVQDGVAHIGCGQAQCSGGYKTICNYIEANYETIKPYTNGTAASDCGTGSLRDGNLCDCGGKLCRNQGVLDLKTCTCQCKENFSGPECETVTCPSTPDPSWPCTQYDCAFWTFYQCPYKCGYCQKECPLSGCQNGGTMHNFPSASCSCTCPEDRTGSECETLVCPSNPDPSWPCGKSGSGGSYECSNGWFKDQCYYTCGQCQTPCSKSCKNGGTMVDYKKDTCSCQCKDGFSGDQCEFCTTDSDPNWPCISKGEPASTYDCANKWYRDQCPYTCENCTKA